MLSSLRSRVLAGVLGTGALLAVTVVVLPDSTPDESPSDDALQASAEDDRDADAAQTRLIADLGERRTAMSEPAFTARENTARLRLLLAEAVAGGDREADRVLEQIDVVVARLDDAADALDEAAAAPAPDRPGELDSEALDALLAGLDGLQGQAADVADRLRTATSGATEVANASLELRSAAQRFAGGQDHLPDGDDPEVVASAWSEDADRLAAYEQAALAASELPQLEAHAEVHHEIASALTQLADRAIGDLDAGDLDAYNARISDRLAEVTAALDDLEPRLGDSLQAVVADAESAEERTLGLLSELEQLRAAIPARG
jgi:hypothetical protein